MIPGRGSRDLQHNRTGRPDLVTRIFTEVPSESFAAAAPSWAGRQRRAGRSTGCKQMNAWFARDEEGCCHLLAQNVRYLRCSFVSQSTSIASTACPSRQRTQATALLHVGDAPTALASSPLRWSDDWGSVVAVARGVSLGCALHLRHAIPKTCRPSLDARRCHLRPSGARRHRRSQHQLRLSDVRSRGGCRTTSWWRLRLGRTPGLCSRCSGHSSPWCSTLPR